MLGHCWLGGRKGIRSVKNWAVGCWRGYLSGARCRLAYSPADATATHCLLLQYNLFNGLLSATTQVSRYQKGKTNLDFTEVAVCTLLQADNHANTPPLSFYRLSCRPTNSVEALKAVVILTTVWNTRTTDRHRVGSWVLRTKHYNCYRAWKPVHHKEPSTPGWWHQGKQYRT